MKTWLIRLAILVVIFAEVWWSLALRNFLIPRSEQTVAAIHAYQASSTPENEAAMLEQMHRDGARNTLHAQMQLGLMLVADIAAIYFFWNYGVRKHSAQPSPAAGASRG